MEIAGYIASLFIGVSLGLIGGGGSILTVPVMVYLFAVPTLQAISYSLFVVGITSLVGAFNNYRKGQVSLKTAFIFGCTSIITVFITRKFIIPAIPENLFTIGDYTFTLSLVTMLLFAIVMLLASIAMIKGRKKITASEAVKHSNIQLVKLLAYGVGIGFITGLLGAGGGFILIPALVLLVGLPMKKAVGTSLLIIALNSLIGFLGDIGNVSINWKLILTVAAIAIAGIILGGSLAKKIEGEKLKKGFGWFVLIMGIYIIIKETLLK